MSLGKFFEMPKGIKSAPPQQASLNELWSSSGKKKKAIKAEVKEEAVDVPGAVDRDVEMDNPSSDGQPSPCAYTCSKGVTDVVFNQ